MRRFALILTVSTFEIFSVLPAAGQTFLSDDPVAKWPEPRNAPLVKPRPINEYFDFFQNIMFRPGELADKIGMAIPARAVNTLGEAPDSEWYTNRHYARR